MDLDEEDNENFIEEIEEGGKDFVIDLGNRDDEEKKRQCKLKE